jgi:hypothetical protein
MDTHQIASFFRFDRSPQKRASQILVELSRENLVEGRSRAIGETKVWRLTKKGREIKGVTRRPVPLSKRLDHWLAIGDVYCTLKQSGGLRYFIPELREPIPGTRKVYCGDAFVEWREKRFLLEVQMSPLSTDRWKEKWMVLTEWARRGGLRQASFQRFYKETITPAIVVVTQQSKEVVSGGMDLPLKIVRDIKELF